MSQELTKNLKCVILRNGIEIWLEAERLNNLKTSLKTNPKGFIEIDEEMINSADITGIFTALTMEEFSRRKNGEFKCKFGNWHTKKDNCECVNPKIKELEVEIKKCKFDCQVALHNNNPDGLCEDCRKIYIEILSLRKLI